MSSLTSCDGQWSLKIDIPRGRYEFRFLCNVILATILFHYIKNANPIFIVNPDDLRLGVKDLNFLLVTLDLNTGSMLMWKRLVGRCVMNTIFQRISIAFIDWYLLKKQVEMEKTAIIFITVYEYDDENFLFLIK
ncbi:hypothetical protein T01_8821 [Trichinella spiralis]|uniref:Uncharacterized protein n=1 Tax=Trichinella spiralis TaxID=6334 RepID=A0A0V1BBX6_TRISP|nr:hypothetical protein T01_8821 [Trichinella spiralis]